MSKTDEIEEELTNVLNESARKLNLNKFSLNLNLTPGKGDGFLGEFYRVSILDEETSTTINLIIKKAPTEENRRMETCIECAYKNEIHFYSKVLPALQKFQTERQTSHFFSPFPEYITSVSEIGKELIVLKDITALGYQMKDRNFVLDEKHTEIIFKTYGRFHALSFSFKDQKPEEFHNLTKHFRYYLEELTQNKHFSTALTNIAEESFKALDPVKDHVVREKFRKYVDKAKEIFCENIKYVGNYSGILHGDSWSNNTMFKYEGPDNSRLQNINLIDFQLMNVGTPVYDLSYLLYSGGSKELYDHLEDYLDMYFESFSKFAKELGSDPERLLPRHILTEEWKEYFKYGMLMGFIICKIKTMSKEDSVDMIEKMDDNKKNPLSQTNANQELFHQKVRDVLIHLHEINAL